LKKTSRKPKGSKKLDDFNIISANENGWRHKASCSSKEVNSNWFFAQPKSPEANRALSVCKNCPVKANCLYDAVMYQYHGIWGGYTQEARNKIIAHYLNNDLTSFTLEQAQQIYDHIEQSGQRKSVNTTNVHIKR
jgi:hypothetical protein